MQRPKSTLQNTCGGLNPFCRQGAMLCVLLLAASFGLHAGESDASSVKNSTAERPNILLITADDLGFQLGCYGDKVATTPNLDRLAQEGVRFATAYVTSASCSPSRASLLTGLYPHQNNQLGLAHLGYSMWPGLPNLPGLLKKQGYRTGIIGKLHVEPEGDFPFDYKKLDIAPTRDKAKVSSMCETFLSESDSRPFFLYLNLFDPHHPFLRDVNGSPKMKINPDQITDFPFIGDHSPKFKQNTADYYTCVNRLDEIMGVVMESLQNHGLDPTTIVIFISDNGPPFPRAKCTMFEAGTHIPMIARWTGHIKPGVCEQMVNEIDILPTFLDLVAATPPVGLQGRSLMPLLNSQSVAWREQMATEYNSHEPRMINPQRALREGRYKLIKTLLSDPAFVWPESLTLEKYRKNQPIAGTGEFMELYDLQNDPYEFKNLAGTEGQKATQERLAKALEEWRQETKDPLLDPAGLRAFVLSGKDALPTDVILEELMKKQEEARKAGREVPNTVTPEELDNLHKP
ncbi:MAG: sulfatase [Terrimicrobiaceae bacterium]